MTCLNRPRELFTSSITTAYANSHHSHSSIQIYDIRVSSRSKGHRKTGSRDSSTKRWAASPHLGPQLPERVRRFTNDENCLVLALHAHVQERAGHAARRCSLGGRPFPLDSLPTPFSPLPLREETQLPLILQFNTC